MPTNVWGGIEQNSVLHELHSFVGWVSIPYMGKEGILGIAVWQTAGC